MTNEELVVRIQAGEQHLMGVLWEQVERLVKWKAHRIMTILNSTGINCGVEFDDLYQSGYLALVAAVKTYSSEEGAFSTWLMYYLQTAFAETSGYHTERQKSDPLRHCISLDAPLGDEDGDTVADLQPDSGSTAPFESVEQQMYLARLREVLDKALSELPPQLEAVIRQRYFETATFEQIAETLEVSTSRAQQLEEKALCALREQPHRDNLETFVESRTPYFLHVGPTEFQRSRESAVEKIYFLRERLRRLSENTR